MMIKEDEKQLETGRSKLSDHRVYAINPRAGQWVRPKLIPSNSAS